MHWWWWLKHIPNHKHTAVPHTLSSSQSYQLHKFVDGIIVMKQTMNSSSLYSGVREFGFPSPMNDEADNHVISKHDSLTTTDFYIMKTMDIDLCYH